MTYEPSEEFNNAVKKLGRTPFDPTDSLAAIYLDMYSDYQARFEFFLERRIAGQKPGHRVLVGFVDGLGWNGFAATLDGVDVIGINHGVLPIAATLFTSLLSHPHVLPAFSNTAAEVMPYLDGKPIGARFANLKSGVGWGPPNDHERGAAALFMISCAIQFIFQHELGHIWNGHTSLWQSKYGLSAVDEVEQQSVAPAWLMDSQTMEMDADGFAIANVIGPLMDFPLHEGEEGWPAWEAQAPHSTRFRLALFAVYMTFRMFDEEIANFDLNARRHPPFAFRQAAAGGIALNAAVSRHGWKAKVAEQIVRDTIVDAEVAFSLFNEARSPSGLLWAASEANREYELRLSRHWNTMRPQLDPLKRGGNLPPLHKV